MASMIVDSEVAAPGTGMEWLNEEVESQPNTSRKSQKTTSSKEETEAELNHVKASLKLLQAMRLMMSAIF